MCLVQRVNIVLRHIMVLLENESLWQELEQSSVLREHF